MISTTCLLSPGEVGCADTRAAYRVAVASMDPTTAATEGAAEPIAGWVTSAPSSMNGFLRNSAMKGGMDAMEPDASATFVPPSLAFTFMATLAMYCSWPRGLRSPTPALDATMHWLGMPRELSEACLTMRYSSAPVSGSTTRMSPAFLPNFRCACPEACAITGPTGSLDRTCMSGGLGATCTPQACMPLMNSPTNGARPSTSQRLDANDTTHHDSRREPVRNLISRRFHEPRLPGS